MATTKDRAKTAGTLATPKGTTRITVDLGNEKLYKAVRVLAIEQGKSVREVVVEALRLWIEEQEDKEDLRDYREAKDEPVVAWEEVESELRALAGCGKTLIPPPTDLLPDMLLGLIPGC